MSLVRLRDVLQPALSNHYAIAGLVVLGWEDARAFVEAAEAENTPIILQAGPSCRSHTPLPVLGAMFRYLAENASVPIVAHLDHGYTIQECQLAIDSGFSSIMFDGSKKPLQQNIDETAEIVAIAHRSQVCCEGEIGFVGYWQGQKQASKGTDPLEAKQFAQQTAVDAMAISVGNVHLQENQEGAIDQQRVRAIEKQIAHNPIPLVIHGGSGVPSAQRTFLAQHSCICKFNIGTQLRKITGQAIRESVNKDPNRYDRVTILQEIHQPLYSAARKVIATLKPQAR